MSDQKSNYLLQSSKLLNELTCSNIKTLVSDKIRCSMCGGEGFHTIDEYWNTEQGKLHIKLLPLYEYSSLGEIETRIHWALCIKSMLGYKKGFLYKCIDKGEAFAFGEYFEHYFPKESSDENNYILFKDIFKILL